MNNIIAKQGSLIVLSGFSGVGKGTVLREMMGKHDNYAYSVSVTTRLPREGEADGREYFFRTRDQFEAMIGRGDLLEYACYVDHYYGTPRDYVLQKMREGKDVILEIEVQGALKVREKVPEAVLIYLLPPDVETLKGRLTRRGTEKPEVVRSRLEEASHEAAHLDAYDYVLVNDEVEACADQLHQLIWAQRYRTGKNLDLVRSIQEGFAKATSQS